MSAAETAHRRASRAMSAEKLRQATAVAIDGRALLIEGPPGSGKTSLALALIDRGATLIGDDGVALAVKDGQLVASAPMNTKGRLEIRNVAIVDLPSTSAPVALILTLSADAQRYVERAGTIQIEGYSIPELEITLVGDANAIRAEYALRIHGADIGTATG